MYIVYFHTVVLSFRKKKYEKPNNNKTKNNVKIRSGMISYKTTFHQTPED